MKNTLPEKEVKRHPHDHRIGTGERQERQLGEIVLNPKALWLSAKTDIDARPRKDLGSVY